MKATKVCVVVCQKCKSTNTKMGNEIGQHVCGSCGHSWSDPTAPEKFVRQMNLLLKLLGDKTIKTKEIVYKNGCCPICSHTDYTLEETGCERCFSFKRKCNKKECGHLYNEGEPLILC